MHPLKQRYIDDRRLGRIQIRYSLIAIVLLSLGLWAAIWGIVAYPLASLTKL